MKNKSLIIFLLLIAGCFFHNAGICQSKDSLPSIEKKLADRNFVFVAQSALPLKGGIRFLTAQYDLTVRGDSLISFLPYFGTAYVAPVGTDDAGIIFTTTNFDYKYEKNQKGNREVSIKINDKRNTQQFNFVISKNGSALLNVNSFSRDPISFRGYIKE